MREARSKFALQSPLLYRARGDRVKASSRWVLDGKDEGKFVVRDVDDAVRTAQVAVPTVGHGSLWQTSNSHPILALAEITAGSNCTKSM